MAAKRPAAAAGVWHSESGFALQINRSRAYVQECERRGMPWKPGAGSRKMYGPPALEWLIEDAMQKGRESAPDAPKQSGDYRSEIEREKLAQLRRDNALRNREVAPIAMFGEWVGKVSGSLRTHLDAVVPNVKRQVQHLRAAELAIIGNEIVKSCNAAIADFDPTNSRAA